MCDEWEMTLLERTGTCNQCDMALEGHPGPAEKEAKSSLSGTARVTVLPLASSPLLLWSP